MLFLPPSFFGRGGLEKDEAVALKLLRDAAEDGNAVAKQMLESAKQGK